MPKTKKVTFNMIAADAPATTTDALKWGKDDQYELHVKWTLSFSEALSFVRSIVGSCVNEESGEYNPEVFDFAVSVNILDYYAGIKGLTPEKMDKAYHIVYNTDLVDQVTAKVNNYQLNKLIDAARQKVDHKAAALVSMSTMRLNRLMNSMDEVMKLSQETMDEINSESFQEKMSEAIKAITNAEMAGKDGQENGAASGKSASIPGNIVLLDKGD